MVKRVLEFDNDSDDENVLHEIELILKALMPSWSYKLAWLWLIIDSLSTHYFMCYDSSRGIEMQEDDGRSCTEMRGKWDAAFEILIKHIDAACDEIKALSLQPELENDEA